MGVLLRALPLLLRLPQTKPLYRPNESCPCRVSYRRYLWIQGHKTGRGQKIDPLAGRYRKVAQTKRPEYLLSRSRPEPR